jgi:hypothetical protein
MDVGAFVQENKRWLLGVAGGGLAWLIGSGILGSIYDAESARTAARAVVKSAGATEMYDRSVLATAREEAEKLAAERQRLQAELAFVPTAKFTLSGQGAPDEYLFSVGRALKQGIVDAANDREVLVVEKEVAWDTPTGVDEIRGVLFGLELVDEFTKRLFAAHDAVRKEHPEAIALRAINQCKVEARRGARNTRGSTRPGEVDLRDFVVQERVTFQFQSDEQTCQKFVESCRQPGRTLVIDSWQVISPTRLGEPCSVKGVLQGIAFK